jgi:BirA family biotin operon repressor/biotin-[acetyl-CoA-carboxylase] ligase
MSAADFTNALDPLASRHRVTWYDVTDSTNTRAIDACANGAARDGDVFLAGAQTAGRGTDGHAWVSNEPVGLWVSVVFREPLRARPLSLLPAVALATVLRRGFGVSAHLKWPNDVLVGAGDATRKIAGILVESAHSASGCAWVVGIGVNLNQPQFAPPLDTIATSVRRRAGAAVNIPAFCAALLAEMARLDRPGADLPTLWTELSRMPGRTIRFRRAGGEAAARVDGVNGAGHLLLTHTDGRREALVGATGIDIHPGY